MPSLSTLSFLCPTGGGCFDASLEVDLIHLLRRTSAQGKVVGQSTYMTILTFWYSMYRAVIDMQIFCSIDEC
jgi:hypothetical protein